MDVRDRHAELVFFVRVQRDAIRRAREILSQYPQAGDIRVVVDRGGALASPGARREIQREARQALREQFEIVAADEAALRIEARFVHHDRGLRGAAIEMHGLVEDAKTAPLVWRM